MRERQRQAVHEWFKQNGRVVISSEDGLFTLAWNHTGGRRKSIQGVEGDTVDSLLLELTHKRWKALEEQDRANEPTYDRT